MTAKYVKSDPKYDDVEFNEIKAKNLRIMFFSEEVWHILTHILDESDNQLILNQNVVFIAICD